MNKSKTLYFASIVILISFIILVSCTRRVFLPITNNLRRSGSTNATVQVTEDARNTSTALHSPITIPVFSTTKPKTQNSTSTPHVNELRLPLMQNLRSQVDMNWQLSPKVIQGNHDNSNASMLLRYPLIFGHNNPKLDRFNEQVQNWINIETDQFLQIAQSISQGTGPRFLNATYTLPSSPDWSIQQNRVLFPAEPNTYEGSQTALDNGSPVISVLFETNGYSGGAHPWDSHYSLNFDLKAGKVLTLSDLFRENQNYLTFISNYAIRELTQRNELDGEQINAGASPVLDNYKIWNITPQGLLITFEEYQVGPYAAGPQWVLIPYNYLTPILSSDGPLAKYAGTGK